MGTKLGGRWEHFGTSNHLDGYWSFPWPRPARFRDDTRSKGAALVSLFGVKV